MKKNLFLAVTGLAVTLGLGMSACQSSDSSNGGDATTGPTGTGGDSGTPGAGGSTGGSSAGTSSAGTTGTPGAGGSTAGSTGTPGAGGNGTPGAGGNGTPGTGGNGTPGAGGNGTPGAGGSTGGTPGVGGSGGDMGTGGAGGDAAGGAGGAGGAKVCKEIKLHPGKAGMPSLFCPFSNDGMGNTVYCNAPTEHCCEGAKAGDISSCQPAATMCPAGDADWQCFDSATDCPASNVCCVYGMNPITNTVDSMCSAMFPNNHFLGGKVQGTKCATSCDTMKEMQVCESDAECTAPQKCLPTASKGAQFGVCGMLSTHRDLERRADRRSEAGRDLIEVLARFLSIDRARSPSNARGRSFRRGRRVCCPLHL